MTSSINDFVEENIDSLYESFGRGLDLLSESKTAGPMFSIIGQLANLYVRSNDSDGFTYRDSLSVSGGLGSGPINLH